MQAVITTARSVDADSFVAGPDSPLCFCAGRRSSAISIGLFSNRRENYNILPTAFFWRNKVCVALALALDYVLE